MNTINELWSLSTNTLTKAVSCFLCLSFVTDSAIAKNASNVLWDLWDTFKLKPTKEL